MRLFQLTYASMPALLELATADDRILLRQDATYLLLSDMTWPCPVFVLQQDMLSRGLQCPPSMTLVSDHEWVEMSLAAKQVITCKH